MFRGDGVSGASWMPLRFWLLAAIIAVVVGTAAVVAYLSWNVRFTAEKALEVNWGLELPRGSEILEHHKEDSFQGTGIGSRLFRSSIRRRGKTESAGQARTWILAR